MFIKPFKIKSNTQIKTTERKKIRGHIENAFKISDDDLNKLFPNKSILNQLKLITNSNDQVTLYSCDRRPMFFEFNLRDLHSEKIILAPTVYSLWIVPNLVPAFTTHPAVLPRLAGGADLMLPGISCSPYNTHIFQNETSNKLSTLFRCHKTRQWIQQLWFLSKECRCGCKFVIEFICSWCWNIGKIQCRSFYVRQCWDLCKYVACIWG